MGNEFSVPSSQNNLSSDGTLVVHKSPIASREDLPGTWHEAPVTELGDSLAMSTIEAMDEAPVPKPNDLFTMSGIETLSEAPFTATSSNTVEEDVSDGSKFNLK